MMSASTRKKEAKPITDCKQPIYHPLDFSFKVVQDFSDLLREKPRVREQQLQGVVSLEDELVDSSTGSLDVEKSHSTALRVNNNILISWNGFMSTISRLFEDPATKLGWIDFSFNDLKTIDDCLLELPNLMMLYFHGNNITALSQVDKLSRLSRLKSLSLHGNPIEINSGYRFYVLSRIPQLQTFDFSGITKADRASCETWKTMIAPKPKSRKRKN